MHAPRRTPTRRHFLRGAGGLLLALPFLEGLAPKPAAAGPPGVRKRFVAMLSGHGGALGSLLHPPQATLGESTTFAGQTVRRGDLDLAVSGGTASLSPILSASSSLFTPALAAKMNVVRGLSVPFYTAHHRGGYLGNWDVVGNPHGFEHIPTIDQVMAWSPSFYETTPLVRSMVCSNGEHTFCWQNPVDKTGPVTTVAPFISSRSLFDNIYVPPTDEGTEARPPVVDLVLADYNRLRNSARLSSKDRERLDAHVQKLDELEKKLDTVVSCGEVEPTGSTDDFGTVYAGTVDDLVAYWRLYCDVVAIAFACDTSRIAVLPITSIRDDSYYGYDGNWHDDVAHRAGYDNPAGVGPDDPNGVQAQSYRRQFEDLYLYMLQKLDEIDDGAGSVLDKSLVTWSFEAGIYTHDAWDMPVIMGGGAAGEIVTGKHIDYRDMNNRVGDAGDPASNKPERIYTGLTWHQYMATVMQAMGLDPAEYESGGQKGYGQHFIQEDWGFNQHSAQVLAAQGDFLPLLKP
jgi:hypothetical protein